MATYSQAGKYGPATVPGAPVGLPLRVVASNGSDAVLYTEASKNKIAGPIVRSNEAGLVTFFADPGVYNVRWTGGAVNVTVTGGAEVTTTSDPEPPFYLPSKSALRRLRAAMARQAFGGTPAKILFKGDSTTYGVLGNGGNGAGAIYNPSNLTSPSAISWVDRTRRLLTTSNALGARVDEGAIWTAAATNDTRFTAGTGWSVGGAWSATPATAGTLTFADTGASNNAYDLWVMKTSGTAVTFPVTIDAETPLVVDLSAQAVNTALVAKRVTSTVGLGAHNVVIGAPTGGNISIFAVESHNTTTPPVARFSRHGISGQMLSTFVNTNSMASGGQFWLTHTQYVPDATVLLMGINDLHNSTLGSIDEAASAFRSSLVSYVTATQALGADVILGVFPSSGYAAAQLNPGPDEAVKFHEVIYEVADQYNCAVFDLQRRWGYGQGPIAFSGTPTPAPLYDGVHPTLAGYQDMARMMASFMASAV